MYETPQDFENEVYSRTYFTLIIFLEKNFKLADELALQIKPELKEFMQNIKDKDGNSAEERFIFEQSKKEKMER